MRLLLTRAAEDAVRTREKLEAMGHSVILSPVIEMVGTGAVWPSGVVDAVLATSGQAFAALQNLPSPEAQRVLPLYLVGTRTADTARALGFLGAAAVATNAAALAGLLGQLADRPKRIVYLAGRDRKPDLETALEGINQTLDVVEVYEARALDVPSPEAVKALRYYSVDGVLHFSRRSVSLFATAVAAAGLNLGQPAHFCLSEDVAAPLREAGCATISVASTPNEADLLALVGQVRNVTG